VDPENIHSTLKEGQMDVKILKGREPKTGFPGEC